MANETDTMVPEKAAPEVSPLMEPDSVLSKRIAEAELMLAHAAETGINLSPEVVGTIANACDAVGRHAWTMSLTQQFWPAYTKLCAAIKPVTGESLIACAGTGVAQTLTRYRTGTFYLAFVILPLSVLMFINSSLSTEISERVKENDALALTLRGQLSGLPETNSGPNQVGVASDAERSSSGPHNEIVRNLQQFASTNRFLYGRAALLNLFILYFEPNVFLVQLCGEQKSVDSNCRLSIRDALELPVPLKDAGLKEEGEKKTKTYQDIRAYAKNVQETNLMFSGAITAYVLPILYALLGACAYALRSLSQQAIARTYTPTHADFARVIIALIAGLVVGLFNNFGQATLLSPLAIAFLVGYAVEVFFSFLDAILDTMKKVKS